MKRTSLVLAAALAIMLSVSCGGDEGTSSEPAPATAVAATVSTAGAGGTANPTTVTSAGSDGSSETPIPEASEVVASTYTTLTSDLPLVRFEQASVELPVEVPPRSEYAIGLSGREYLDRRGMLFYREDFGQTAFWMKNTHIDLDIAFVDADRRILLITTMFADTEDIHRPDSPYVVAIEAPAGWYATHGVTKGDTVEYLFDLESTVTD